MKNTSQVGAYSGQVASRAVDGVATPNDANHCAHPDTTDTGESIAWWEVDLGDIYVINNITIVNGHESKRKRYTHSHFSTRLSSRVSEMVDTLLERLSHEHYLVRNVVYFILKYIMKILPELFIY